jgi:hypothetical protein
MEWNDIPSPASFDRELPRKGGLPGGPNVSPRGSNQLRQEASK